MDTLLDTYPPARGHGDPTGTPDDGPTYNVAPDAADPGVMLSVPVIAGYGVIVSTPTGHGSDMDETARFMTPDPVPPSPWSLAARYGSGPAEYHGIPSPLVGPTHVYRDPSGRLATVTGIRSTGDAVAMGYGPDPVPWSFLTFTPTDGVPVLSGPPEYRYNVDATWSRDTGDGWTRSGQCPADVVTAPDAQAAADRYRDRLTRDHPAGTAFHVSSVSMTGPPETYGDPLT